MGEESNICFNNGMNGKCDPECKVFTSGLCQEYQETGKEEIVSTHGEDEANRIMALYIDDPKDWPKD